MARTVALCCRGCKEPVLMAHHGETYPVSGAEVLRVRRGGILVVRCPYPDCNTVTGDTEITDEDAPLSVS